MLFINLENVEIHIKSSDWYVHNHENDKNYDNVILHVVWEHDTDVFRKDKTTIPTLELKSYFLINLRDKRIFSDSSGIIQVINFSLF